MSLQVWLPLTKDLRQQGLSNITVTNNGATYSSTGGKLGGCYNFNGTSKYLNLSSYMTTLKTFTNYSMSAWVYLTGQASGHSASILSSGNWNTAAGQLVFGLYSWSSDHYTKILVPNRSGWSNGVNYNIYTNTWYHIVLTYNGSKTFVYVNGEKIGEYNSGGIAQSSETDNLYVGCATYYGSFNLVGNLNDVRIYDHCLSPLEVKQISQGLRLHYPLDRNSSYISLIDKTASYNIYNNYGVTASLTATGETYLGSPVRRLSMTPDSSHLSNFQTSLGNHGVYNWSRTFSASTKYVFWIYYKPVSHMDVRVGGTASNISGWTEIPPKAVGDGWYVVGQYRNGTVTSDKTDNIFVSFYSPTAATGTPILIDFACPTLVQGLTEIQSSINWSTGNAVYDTSGYCYNATSTGTMHNTSDTPKYSASLQFDSTSTKIQLPVMDFTGMANSYTFAWWQYNVSTGNMPWGFSNGNRLNVYHTSPLCWNTGDGSSNQFKDGSITITPASVQNAWHHMVVTGDGTSTKLYIDGVYRGTATTYKALTGTQIWISGWDSGTTYTFNGCKESDFRIYATALSADDVKSLYQNCATIDPDGTIRGQIRS